MRKLCEEKRIREDGTANIYFQYFPGDGHRIFLNTGVSIPPKFWDTRKEKIKDNLPASFGDHSQLNQELTRQFRLAEDLIELAKSRNIENHAGFIKEKFCPTLNLESLKRSDWRLRHEMEAPKKSFFIEQMEDYIKTKEKKVKCNSHYLI